MDTKKLRQKILDLAIHGKLVPQDPNDEPASVLLERIRAEKERLISEGKIKRSRKTLNTTDTHHYEQDVPFEVPQGWVWCKLDDLAFYKKGPFGSSLTKSMFVLKGDNTYKVYEQKNAIQKNEKLGTYYISKEKYQELIAFAIQPFDIIVSCAGTIGETFVLPQEPMEGIINQALMLVRLYNRDIEKFYLLYFDYILKEEAYKESKGTAIKNIPPFDVLKNFYIPLPPFSEQQRIVAEIERWFALIDTIEQGKVELQTAIKQTKSKILDLAIHGKLVPQDPSDEPAIELVRRINPKAQITCDNEHYAQLPRGWSVISMQDICKLKDGIKRDNTSLINLDVKYLRGISEGNIIHNGKFVPANSYMFLVDGENSGEVFRTPIDGYQGSTFKLLDIDQNVNEKYILNVINLHRKTLRENKVGSAIPHLNKKLFKAIAVPLPPYNEQIRIVEAIKSTFNILDAIKENL